MSKKWNIILTILLLMVFIPSTFLLIRKQFNDASGADARQEAIELSGQQDATSEPAATTLPTVESTATAPEETLPDPELEIIATLEAVDLAALREVNPEVWGWILIPGTEINHPVLLGSDNDFYLTHNWKRESNYMGAIFLEYTNSPDLADHNTIIYGHNMRNGTMFSDIYSYREQAFYDAHPCVYLVTDQGIFRCSIFSAHLAELDSLSYRMIMEEESARREFLTYTLAESAIVTAVEPGPDEKILTLSTCSAEDYDRRWVVHATLELIRSP